MMTNKEKLDIALGALNKMKLVVQEMHDKNKTVFDGNRTLNREYKNIVSKIDDAINQLCHPVLSLATIGTTSAGKSTIVNALAGRTIAPMNSKEMSAGVLKLLPGETVSLEIQKSSNWEYGTFDPITDAEAYQKISNIFQRYHKFERITTPPEITVKGPLLWSRHPEMIGLPDDVSFRFVDLPGLKTITDKKNLEVIKGYLSNSVCIIAMDYNDVDESLINRLLEELKEIIEALDGNDGSILFLLNKVDSRRNTDQPLSDRIRELETAIKKSLPLKDGTDINIIPFSSGMLYYAQGALGNAHYKDEDVTIDFKQIGELIQTYASRFADNRDSQVVEAYNRVKMCYKSIYDKFDEFCGIEQTATPSTADAITLIAAAYRMSHANAFLEALKERIEESFEYVIIYPAINNVLKSVEDFCSKLKTYAAIKKNDNKVNLLMSQISLLKERVKLVGCAPKKNKETDEVCNDDEDYKAYKKQLEAIRTELEQIPTEDIKAQYKVIMSEEIDALSKTIESKPVGEIDKRLDEIDNNTVSIANKLLEIIKKKGNFAPEVNKYFSSIRSTNSSVKIYDEMILVPREIKEKLDVQIISKVYKGLDKHWGTEAMKESLRKNLSTPLIEPFIPSYTQMLNLFKSWDSNHYERKDSHYVITLSSKMSEQRKKEVENTYRSLHLRIRELLSNKTNITFELQSGRFVNALRKFLMEEVNGIISKVNLSFGQEATSLGSYIEKAFANVNDTEIKLPDNLFLFTTPNFDPTQKVNRKWVKTGTETYKEGSCCPTPKTRDVGEFRTETTFVYDKFLDSDGLYSQWQNGVAQSETLFWIILSQWIEETVKAYMGKFASISLQSVCEIDEMIKTRLDEMRTNASNTETKMKELESLVEQLSLTRKQITFN